METRTTAQFKEADVKGALGWLEASESGLSEAAIHAWAAPIGF
ncbi:MAG: hypothetical protein Q7T16_06005 [Candidatus Burarchaeum sp.]|nr:hypothetical protein [Candidatus Burarchaeum sp.]MDO8340181.1 hypothetical protein [Candidatus Burarchaeum sp.]